MRLRGSKFYASGSAAAAALLCALLFDGGCGLTRQDVAGLGGPSELAASLKLTASPDLLTADGRSQALLRAQVRGPNGEGLSGRGVYFAISEDQGGQIAFGDIGKLSSDRAVTNGGGIAEVVYTVPPRTDQTGNRNILVSARLITDDASGQIYRTVGIELRSAEPHIFPQPNGTNQCSTVVEPPSGAFKGKQVLFQDVSTSDMIRVFWDFGDGTPPSDKPDVNHAYAHAGEYSLTHIDTFSNGAEIQCDGPTNITILP